MERRKERTSKCPFSWTITLIEYATKPRTSSYNKLALNTDYRNNANIYDYTIYNYTSPTKRISSHVIAIAINYTYYNFKLHYACHYTPQF